MHNQGLDILSLMLQAGIVVKFILLLLIAASFTSWVIIFKKRKRLNELYDLNKNFKDIYTKHNNLDDIYRETHNLESSPFKHLFLRGHSEMLKLKDGLSTHPNQYQAMKDHFQHFGLKLIQRALESGKAEVNLGLENKLSILASIGSITPFVGLFGTVWGIIDSFTGLGGGGATIEAVAPGIAEALVATAIGLFAAIPAVWFYNSFNDVIAKN